MSENIILVRIFVKITSQMPIDDKDILDYFPEEEQGFNKDDEIVMARVFMDKVEAQMAASILRVKKIPHFIADSNATLFTENILGGERLFVRKEDLEEVAEELENIKSRPYEKEEDWYEEVRTKQGYEPYKKMTYVFIFAIVIFTILMLIIFSGILG